MNICCKLITMKNDAYIANLLLRNIEIQAHKSDKIMKNRENGKLIKISEPKE